MNLMISCIGRQSFLVEKFKTELAYPRKVYASDCDTNAPGLEAADQGLCSPPYEDRRYRDWLLEIVQKHEISLLLTLNVEDLLVLEDMRPQLQDLGCTLIGGNPETIKKTRDKYLLYHFAKANNIEVPFTFLAEEYSVTTNPAFPLIAKPRTGRGSRGIRILKNKAELLDLLSKDKNQYVFQEIVQGQEFGLDVINDFQGNFAGVNVRKKLAMKDGETNRATSENASGWEAYARRLSKMLNHQGTVDLDILLVANKPFLIDVNFRFGGGYIFSELAGSNIPRAYVQWAQERQPDLSCLQSTPGILGQRKGNGRVVHEKTQV